MGMLSTYSSGGLWVLNSAKFHIQRRLWKQWWEDLTLQAVLVAQRHLMPEAGFNQGFFFFSTMPLLTCLPQNRLLLCETFIRSKEIQLHFALSAVARPFNLCKSLLLKSPWAQIKWNVGGNLGKIIVIAFQERQTERSVSLWSQQIVQMLSLTNISAGVNSPSGYQSIIKIPSLPVRKQSSNWREKQAFQALKGVPLPGSAI